MYQKRKYWSKFIDNARAQNVTYMYSIVKKTLYTKDYIQVKVN